MSLPPSTTSAQLGTAIRVLRKSRKMTIEGLAGDACIHWTYLSEIENGKSNPTWNVISRLASALSVEVAELASLAGEQARSEA